MASAGEANCIAVGRWSAPVREQRSPAQRNRPRVCARWFRRARESWAGPPGLGQWWSDSACYENPFQCSDHQWWDAGVSGTVAVSGGFTETVDDSCDSRRVLEIGGKAGEAYHHIQRSSPRLFDEDGDDDKTAVLAENGAHIRHHVQRSTQRLSAADGESAITVAHGHEEAGEADYHLQSSSQLLVEVVGIAGEAHHHIQRSSPRMLNDACDDGTWAGSIPACPQGHAMQLHTKTKVDYECDRCNRYIAKGEHCETWFTDCRAYDFTFCRNCSIQSLSVVAAGGPVGHGQSGERQGHHHVQSSSQRSKTIGGDVDTAAPGHIGGGKHHQVQCSSQRLSEVASDADGTAPQEHNTGTGHHHVQCSSPRSGRQCSPRASSAVGGSKRSREEHHHTQCSSPRSSARLDEGSADVEVPRKGHQAVDGSAACDVDMGNERYHHVSCSRPRLGEMIEERHHLVQFSRPCLGESGSAAAAGSSDFMRGVSSSWHPLDILEMCDVAAVSMVRRHDIAIDTLFDDF